LRFHSFQARAFETRRFIAGSNLVPPGLLFLSRLGGDNPRAVCLQEGSFWRGRTASDHNRQDGFPRLGPREHVPTRPTPACHGIATPEIEILADCFRARRPGVYFYGDSGERLVICLTGGIFCGKASSFCLGELPANSNSSFDRLGQARIYWDS
jgi:hypothetical protein